VTRRTLITSTTNDRLKAVRRLARRRDPGVFLVEGHRQLRRALDADAGVREVYACPELFLGPTDPELVRRAEQSGARVLEVAPQAFRTLANGARPDGLLAVVERWPTVLSTIWLGVRSLVLIAQGIERPGNLGAIVRSACSAGASALLVCDTPVDVFHPDVVRGSVGTLFELPVASCASADAIAWLREREVAIVVATPDGDRCLWDLDLTASVALVLGSERHGVSDTWRRAACAMASIPMPGPSDSLNVAVAAGIALFEAVRQRAAG
jgi:TrmH family RNA methyltransferase